MAYVRTVQTTSGATAVQVVYSKRRGARRMEHIGSAHDEQEVEALKAAARQRLAGGQQQLDLGVDTDDAALAGPGPLPIVASRMEPSSRGELATVEHTSPPVGTPPRHRGGARPGARPLDRPDPPA